MGRPDHSESMDSLVDVMNRRRLGLGVLRGLLMRDGTGVEVRPFGLLLHPHQPLHQVEGVIGRQLTVVAPLER